MEIRKTSSRCYEILLSNSQNHINNFDLLTIGRYTTLKCPQLEILNAITIDVSTLFDLISVFVKYMIVVIQFDH